MKAKQEVARAGTVLQAENILSTTTVLQNKTGLHHLRQDSSEGILSIEAWAGYS